MVLVITGQSGNGKSWIAKEFQNRMDVTQSTIILDCVAELLDTKMRERLTEDVIEEVIEDIHKLKKQTDNLIVVTNQVFSDVPVRTIKQKFIEYLGIINCRLVEECDMFVEVVYGIPICHKGTNI